MSIKQLPLIFPPILGFISLVLPWFTVYTNRGPSQIYYLWGIYSGGNPYFFTLLDPFDLPFLIVFFTCILAVVFETLGALNRRFFVSPSQGILLGAVLAFGSTLNWFLMISQIVTPTFLTGPGYHYQFISSNWSIGLYMMIASGIAAIITYSLTTEARAPRDYSYEIKQFPLKEFHDHKERFILYPSPQKKAKIWSLKKRQSFLGSLCRGYYTPPIVLRTVRTNGEEVKYEVIDGGQRITSIQLFYDKKLELPRTLKSMTRGELLAGRRYDQLKAEQKQWFDKLFLEAKIIRSIEDKINVHA